MNGLSKLTLTSENKYTVQDSGLKSFRVPDIPKTLQFKAVCFSPEKNADPPLALIPKYDKAQRSIESNKSSLPTCTHTQFPHNPGPLTDIYEDNEDDLVSVGLTHNVHSEIMQKAFFNKSIMNFNKSKNKERSCMVTEPASFSVADFNSQVRANSENFCGIEERYNAFEDPEFHTSCRTSQKNPTEHKHHPSLKLDFKAKIPPHDEKAGQSSRLGQNIEEDVKILKLMREEGKKKKREKQNIVSAIKEVNHDLEIYQLHENFEKNLELFKREEEEFLRKVKKINLLEEDSSNEPPPFEKSKIEKDFEESLLHVVLEEKAFSKEIESKTTKNLRENSSKVMESKLSKITVDSQVSHQRSLLSCHTLNKKDSKFEELIKAILSADMAKIDFILEDICPAELNRTDKNGNTPLLLAVKMAHKNEEFQNVIKNILKAGGNPKSKDSNGWTPLDEAITQTNVKVTLYLFDSLCQNKRIQIENEKNKLLEVLEQIPDFYLEMKWDFESSIIPLISHIAPSDTFKIWKHGKSLRVDYGLVGVKNLKAKKRDISLIFNPTNSVLERTDVKEFNQDEIGNVLWLLNNTHKTFTNPLQEIDIHEKKMILYDLLTSQPIEGNMNILDCECRESKNWLGNKINQKINSWKAKRFDLAISYEYKIDKKEHVIINGMEDYLKTTNKKNHENPSENSLEGKEANELKNDKNFIEKLEKLNFNVPIDKRKKIKKTNLMLWISEEFPMKLKDFLPMLSFLSKGSNALNRLSVVLNNEEIQKILNSNGFPVKIQIPFSFSIAANVFFETFKFLEKNDEKYRQLFKIPDELKYVDRKIAQKIMTRPKKRILLANLLI